MKSIEKKLWGQQKTAIYICINKKRKVIRLRPKCAAGPAPSVIPALYHARRRASSPCSLYMYIYILYTIYMYHTTTPHTVAYNNIIHAPPLLYDGDDVRAAVTPRTFLIDFCSRKITNFSPAASFWSSSLSRRWSLCCI